MGGYKAMLRDRMPYVVDLALKWCGAKTAYVDYLYDNYIRKVSKERRSNLVKELLGLKKPYTKDDVIGIFRLFGMKQISEFPDTELYLTFRETIEWAKLALGDRDVFEWWKLVVSWVEWFQTNYAYIENTYKTSQLVYSNESEIISELMSKYSLTEELTNYLIKSFKENE